MIERLAAVVGTDSAGPSTLRRRSVFPTYTWFGPTHPDTWSPPGAMHGALVDLVAMPRLRSHALSALELHARADARERAASG